MLNYFLNVEECDTTDDQPERCSWVQNGCSASLYFVFFLLLYVLCFPKPATLFEEVNHVHRNEQHQRNGKPETVLVV